MAREFTQNLLRILRYASIKANWPAVRKSDDKVELTIAIRYFAAFLRPAWDESVVRKLVNGVLVR